MGLSSDLITQFVKITNDSSDAVEETTVYGTTVEYNGSLYVRLDGSELLTPITTTVALKAGERVTVMIKNHTATVTGNVTSPAAQAKDVENVAEAANKISEFEILVAYRVKVDELEAINATIDNLKAKVASFDSLNSVTADIETLRAEYAKLEYVYAEDVDALNASIENIQAQFGNFADISAEELDAMNADITNLKSYNAGFTYVSADVLKAIKASVDSLEVGNLDATYAKIAELNAVKAKVTQLNTDVADIDTLMFGSASGNTIQSSFANAVIAQLGDAQIKSAMIESVSANKITAGDIITNNVRVMSEDGSLIISDETIQISDKTRVRVQIGKDAANDYSINIWDADGNLMFSEGGITDNAIKDAIIRNDMVSDTANIAAHKLNIDSLFEEINGSTNTIKSTQIYLDDQAQTLNVAFKELETEISDLGTTVSSQGTQISVMQGDIESKIWQQDIDTAINEVEGITETLSTKFTSLEQEIDSVSVTVASHETAVGSLEKRVTTAEALIEANTTNIELRVTRKEFAAASEQLSISGRNLIVRRGELIDTYVVASGEITDSDVAYRSATMVDPIRIDEGETYTFSKGAAALEYFFRWAWFDYDMNVLGRTTDNLTTFTWTAPENAAYVIVSYPYVEGSNVKMEKGDTATEYCPAVEDMGSAIDAVDSRFDEYSTTVDMNAAIKLSADNITSSVSKTYTTKTDFNALEIGGCNLIKNSNFASGLSKWVPVGVTCTTEADDTHGTCVKIISTEVGSSNSRIYPSTTDNFVHTGGTYSLSFYAKAEADTTMQTNVAGGTAGVGNYNLTTVWKRFTNIYEASAGSITFWSNEANTTIYLTKVKLEHGDKTTDWTPAPEDMATEGDVADIQASVDSADERITTNETLIQQLSDSISTLVRDANGASLMTQTSEGWTFSTAEIQALIDTTVENLTSLTAEVGDTNNTVEVLQQAVADLGEIAEYVKIRTYDGEPCIELGEGDSEFKLRITNTRILFMEGSSVIAHFTNQSLHINKAVIEEELQQGEFVWKARANGNLGLIWKGVNS